MATEQAGAGRYEAVAGCLLGMAIGDALAAPTEFMRDMEDIKRLFGRQGPEKPSGRVTDDTQMALTVKTPGDASPSITIVRRPAGYEKGMATTQ